MVKTTQQEFAELGKAARECGMKICDVLRVTKGVNATAKFIDRHPKTFRAIDRLPIFPWYVALLIVVIIPQIFGLSIMWLGEWWK